MIIYQFLMFFNTNLAGLGNVGFTDAIEQTTVYFSSVAVNTTHVHVDNCSIYCVDTQGG